MKIIEMKSKAEKELSFTSANDKIKINITNNDGPELILEDGSNLIFNSIIGYYKTISNADIYNTEDNSINMNNFKENYFKDSDDVVNVKYRNRNITSVETYEFDSAKIIRLI